VAEAAEAVEEAAEAVVVVPVRDRGSEEPGRQLRRHPPRCKTGGRCGC
jgi:hypothetical protein